MAKMEYYIIKNCPLCSKAVRLNITGWEPLYDSYGDGGVTSFAVQCAKCNRYISGRLFYPHDGPLMDNNTLEKHSDPSGDVSILFETNCEFDQKEYKLWHQWSTGSSDSPDINGLMNQIEICMNQNCHDAVALLCRKVVEILINRMIDVADIDELNKKIKSDKVNTLAELREAKLGFKIRYIFPPEKDNGNRPDIYHRAQLIRLFGNKSAHEERPFSQKDAESAYAFTREFLLIAQV